MIITHTKITSLTNFQNFSRNIHQTNHHPPTRNPRESTRCAHQHQTIRLTFHP